MRDMEHSLGVSGQSRHKVLNLVTDPEYALRYQLASLAKHHNCFGGVDQYMKEFGAICMELGNRSVVANLERVLNAEVAITTKAPAEPLLKGYREIAHEVDPLVLSQPRFNFLPAGLKLNTVQNYLDLLKEQDRTREAIFLLQKATQDPAVFANLTSEFGKMQQLLAELDSEQSDVKLHLNN